MNENFEPKKIIEALHKSRLNMGWIDVLSHAQAEAATTNDYRGRAIFELFQNAVDRAESRVWVSLDRKNHTLTVANDGDPFFIKPYDPEKVDKLDDFHSLCSIHTSSKEAGKSIGNKGIGFKSVWEYAKSVKIASTLDNNGRHWGFRLFNPFKPEEMKHKIWPAPPPPDCELISDFFGKMKDKPIPSFYFPEYLDAAKEDIAGLFTRYEQAKTVITLEGIDATKLEPLKKKIDEFPKSKLFFVPLILAKGDKSRPDITVEVEIKGETPFPPMSTTPGDWHLVVAGKHVLQQEWPDLQKSLSDEAKKLSYPIDKPSVVVAFPPEGACQVQSLFYCYLPTQVPCGFDVLIHADFLLDSSRKSIDTKDNPYNKKLLEIAAQVLVAALYDLPEIQNREDASRFLIPLGRKEDDGAMASGAVPPEFLEAVSLQLIDSGLIKTILPRLFLGERGESRSLPKEAYKDILQAINGWRVLVPQGRKTKLLPHIRSSQAPIIPIEWDSGREKSKFAVALPEGDDQVFVRKERDKSTSLTTLAVFKNESLKGLSVTDWEELDDTTMRYLILKDFVLRDVIDKLQGRLLQENFPHADVLKLVTELILISQEKSQLGTEQAEHCRFLLMDEKAKPARNLGKIRLPCVGGGWHQARQTFLSQEENSELKTLLDGHKTFKQVDTAELQKLIGNLLQLHAPELSDCTAIATFLGSWKHIPLDLVLAEKKLTLPWRKPDFANLEENQKKLFFKLLPASWSFWKRDLGLDALKEVQEVLRESPWFPLSKQWNPSDRFVCPRLVFRVSVNDTEKLDFFAKHSPNDNEVAKHLLQDLGVVAIEEADEEKILQQLQYMKSEPDPQHLVKAMAFRAKYQDLIRRLAKLWGEQAPNPEKLSRVPLLTQKGRLLAWATNERQQPIWFVQKKHWGSRYIFRKLTYAALDPETPVGFAKKILELESLDPQWQLKGGQDLTEDPQVKQELAKVMPDLFAMTQVMRIGGEVNIDEVIKRWLKTVVKKGENISQHAWPNPLRQDEQREVIGEKKDKDVFYEIADNELTVAHDIAGDAATSELWRFAAALSEGVFNNAGYALYFSNFLRTAENERKDQLNRMGVTDAELDEAKQVFASASLNSSQLQELDEKLSELLRDGRPHPPGEKITEPWWKPETYTGLPLTGEEVLKSLPDFIQKTGISIDPWPSNERSAREKAAALADNLCIALMLKEKKSPDEARSLAQQLKGDDWFKPYGLERFDFQPEKALREFLKGKITTDIGQSLKEWVEEARKEPDWYVAKFQFDEENFHVAHNSATTQLFANPATVSPPGRKLYLTKSSEKRAADDQEKSRAGLKAQKWLALKESIRLLNNKESWEQNWPLIRQEWAEIENRKPDVQQYSNKLATDFDSVEKLAECLEVGRHVDGLGYDVVTVKDNRLVKIEVKCSRRALQHQPEIFLSANELRVAIEELSAPNPSWRLILFAGEESNLQQFDITDQIRSILDATTTKQLEPFNQTGAKLEPVSWHITFQP